uniref:Uncharacterized protein n=1 Tax=Rhizochromulina marina TaxID=1034831 RepID=A0A7S2RH37_9STRA|mmetsp:Transcript_16179/g.47513  ORF Transcript_16179/g.47513 Transcript_16179/m.47513 type:complete len:325 (+) Transcript_16179:60-1034(+)|eukprot:CAMPEP_0118978536 /NCGR_PEP_ID=MMETSP1173-20130426/23934_1 /TAXON_ID=1034831 /ORGANISM="Rhizochromulina marina cf, Strain CCMP1243" /LENGTH=324 /DNA_ID=CAMNT_0006928735 /DNA_START=44 /DNA_END=1018 /DNA_ORIENTATION=-
MGGQAADVSAERFRQSVLSTVGCVALAVVFGAGVWHFRGRQSGFEFFAGYLVEQSLSVDNLFVFLMLFNYFQVPLSYQGRVLTWGIIGAVVMRGIMIVAGVAAVQKFRMVILLFAAILMLSAVKLFFESDEPEDLSNNTVMRLSKFAVGAVEEYDGDKFFTILDGQRRATPLLLCLVCIELSDFVFAVDSIPAVIGVSQDLLIVYSSNIFAIMGLRSLYTLVAKAVQDLPYLRPAVALVLAFIGLKMVMEFFHYEISISLSLGVVVTLLASGIVLSLIHKKPRVDKEPPVFDGHTVSQAVHSGGIDQQGTLTNRRAALAPDGLV